MFSFFRGDYGQDVVSTSERDGVRCSHPDDEPSAWFVLRDTHPQGGQTLLRPCSSRIVIASLSHLPSPAVIP